MHPRISILALCSLVACGDDVPIVGGTGSSSTASLDGSTTVVGTMSTTSTGSSSEGSSAPAETTMDPATGSSTTTTTATTGSSGEASTGATTGSSGEASTGTTDGSTGTSGGMEECQPTYPDGDMLCADGQVVAGELCYEMVPPLQDMGTFATRVWAGDLDDDGDPDAMVLVEFPAAMAVLLNDGLGNLVHDDTYGLVMGANTGARDVAVGDMDEDGWVDAVVAFTSPPSLLVLENDGGGAFGFPVVTPLAQAPHAVVVADLDGDFLDDAVVSDALGVTVYYGLGNQSFGMSSSLADPALVEGRDLALADFDGDADLDVAVTFSQTVAVFPNVGGVLQAPSTTPVATSVFGPNDVAVGDMDLDGIPDLVVADSLQNEVHVLIGVGNGTFVPNPMPVAGRYAVVGEVDADCNPDVLTRTAPLMVDLLTIYPGDGAGGLATGTSFGLYSGMVDLEGADFDGDLLTDALFAIGPSGEVGVARTEP
ncbi:FG-GAP repeat domain-containing protein [Paraliomyxa miuraensis]|uniref:FG-GAP repeat domain-containing protein n=1 Tax=Paraliomyxa miuraensis TaxID=376150 RepID=UPI002258D3A6|nr:VCBS repeat-containing protein [Paraliomyxa miuraensis]MCX4246812.1 VCBS repeat-containing protein [Paraliomyxa miuraensis]